MRETHNRGTIATPVVVDGRVDDEKLGELMAIGAEHDELDFKAFVDLGGGKSKLGFVKDCIAMMNTPAGGYIAIGLDGHGSPTRSQAEVDAARFDPADLASLVENYVDTSVTIRAGVHQRDGRAIVLVYIGPNLEGLPAPTIKAGAYDGGSAFEKGVFFTRNSTRNVTVQAKHMPRLLQRFRDLAKAEAHEESNRVIAEFVRQIQESNRQGSSTLYPPLLAGADTSSLAAAIVAHLQEGGSPQLNRFIRAQTESASYRGNASAHIEALDSLAIVAIQSLHANNHALFKAAIDGLSTAYESTPTVDTFATTLKAPHEVAIARYWLDVVSRVMLIGAVAVANQRWWTVLMLTVRPVVDQNGYSYSSWLRHAGVFAARANLIPDRSLKRPESPPIYEVNAGPLLSRPRILAVEKPELRDGIAAPNGTGTRDPLLDALAQFDLAWCVAVAVQPPDHTGAREQFYPSFAALDQARSQPMMHQLATKDQLRRALFPDAPPWELNATVALGLSDVLSLAEAESKRFGADWPGVASVPEVARFIEQFATAQLHRR